MDYIKPAAVVESMLSAGNTKAGLYWTYRPAKTEPVAATASPVTEPAEA